MAASADPLIAWLVRSFLEQHTEQGEGLDDCTVEYVLGALTSDSTGEGLQDLDEVLAGMCSGYGNLPADARQELLTDLFQKVHDLQAQGPGVAQEPAEASGAHGYGEDAQHAPTAATAGRPASNTGCTGGERGGEGAGCSASERDSSSAVFWPGIIDEQVDELMALCPCTVSRAFVAHLLVENFDGNLQATADFLLECDRLPERDAAFARQAEQQLRREREEAQALEATRQGIIARFALQEVREAPCNKKAAGKKDAAAPVPLPALVSKAAEPKVRYLNGVAVSHKGEKFVIQTVGEEWDGGSRGKVFTKGKRGKGFT